MNLDDEICHCNHVSLRKLINFARRTRPSDPALMSECLGAGTGCGRCARKLRLIAEMVDKSDAEIIRELVYRWPYD
jgi:bacterioferritin-associated ferredoxin